VTVDGEDLFSVVGVSVRTGEERAEAVIERIIKVAEAGQDAPILRTQETEYGLGIYIDGTYIHTVSDVDVEYEGLDASPLANAIGDRIVEAILAYRERRSEAGMRASFLMAAGWTLAFIVFTATTVFCVRLLRKRADQRTVAWMQRVEQSTGKIVETGTIVSTTRATLWMAMFLILLIAFYYYVSEVLYSFPGTRGIAVVLLENFTGPLLGIVWAIIDEIPSLLMLFIIYLITRYILRILKLVFQNIELGTLRIRGFEIDWTWPTFRIVSVIVVIFAIVIAYPYIPGSETAAFKGITIFVGVVLSLGSSSVMSNLLSGLFVIYRRSVNAGDWIDVKGHVGKVESITLLETILRSAKNELISIPNSQLLGSELTNFTRQGETEGLLVHTTVGIGYEEPQRKVERMLIEAASRTSSLKKRPKPFVLRKALADYAVNYELNAYAKQVDGLPRTESDLHANILDVFNENQVQIMTPSYFSDPEEPKIAPTDDIEAVETSEARPPSSHLKLVDKKEGQPPQSKPPKDADR
jgi:small-conductance mechanosensitive channel